VRLKLDENLGWTIAERLRHAGHDVATVRDEGLGAADDDALFARCRQEGRCLVTLDLDFGNVLRFPPEQTAGLAVLRPAGKPTLAALGRLAGELVEALSRESIAGCLWIIEPGRIRIHESSETE
jgi:NAD(P)-dependent dehydrogenase (short-subunit alcohol dehydrogenase family)